MRVIVSEMALSSLPERRDVEIVERKGAGHPDTICDALSDAVGMALRREYCKSFGHVLHYNVDKALLRGGKSSPKFGGGQVDQPMEFYLSGRAMGSDHKRIPFDDIVMETCQNWLAERLHALDVKAHARIHSLIRPGSSNLAQLFAQSSDGVILANDTSYGVGYAPLSPLERIVLKVEEELTTTQRSQYPEVGEDVKVMGIRFGERISLTIACAFVDRFLQNLDAYLNAKNRVKIRVERVAREIWGHELEVLVNAADDANRGDVYLTVTGTSAECGDDGQVGRGNRVNGLITPGRPMSLEAAAGKNPITHTGKIYNVAANDIATAVVSEVSGIFAAECYLVSQIGAPIGEPAIAQIRAAGTDEGKISKEQSAKAQDLMIQHLKKLEETAKLAWRGEG